MSVINMSKNIKDVHPNFLICYKVGSFYHSYGKDAYILSYLFGYKINTKNDNVSVSGFPKSALPKVTAKLEHNKINYMLLDTRNNYDIDVKEDNKNLNKYEELLEKAQKYIRTERRIERIIGVLKEENNEKKLKEKLSRIEELIYED